MGMKREVPTRRERAERWFRDEVRSSGMLVVALALLSAMLAVAALAHETSPPIERRPAPFVDVTNGSGIVYSPPRSEP